MNGVKIRYINSTGKEAVCFINYISMDAEGIVYFQEAGTRNVGRSKNKISDQDYSVILSSFMNRNSIDLTNGIAVTIVWNANIWNWIL